VYRDGNSGMLLEGGPDRDLSRLSRRGFVGAAATALWLAAKGREDALAGTIRRSFYVSNAGSDSNPGSATRPFATINGVFRSIADLGSGDQIVVMPGTYNEAVSIKAGGTAAANLTLKSQVPYGARIRSPSASYSAINIQKSYVTVDGFDVQGGGTGHGIEATYLDGNIAKPGPHHLKIINNVCHDNAGSGISVSYGDYYLIENNVCYGNCATNSYQGSGISIYEPRAVAGRQTLRIFVLRNTCFGNTALVLANNAPHSDGNGIILDDFRNTQQPNAAGNYRYRSLVENNVCYFNGGRGIHVFLSDNITVRNNTCAFNNRDLMNTATWRGELSNVNSSNIVWVNNIGYADTGVNAYNSGILHGTTSSSTSSNVVWRRNLTFNGTEGSASFTQSPFNASLTSAGPYYNMFGVNPLFIAAGPEITSCDLHLQPTSKARNVATSQYGLGRIDRDGKPRVYGTAADLGAYELQR
jgi:parallel beta-helix repeat protein